MSPATSLAAVPPLSAAALVVHVVLAHRRPAFHPRTCGLHGGAAATAGIKYEELGSWDVIDYFLYIDARLLPLRCASSGNDL